MTQTTVTLARTPTTGTGAYVIDGDAPEFEGTYEYKVFHDDLDESESGIGALSFHPDGYKFLSREIILGNHFNTNSPVDWPLGLKVVEMATIDSSTAAQKKAWADMDKAAEHLRVEHGVSVMLCLAAFEEGHLIGRVAGNYGELPPDVRQAMEALAFQVRCVLVAHAQRRGGVPADE